MGRFYSSVSFALAATISVHVCVPALVGVLVAVVACEYLAELFFILSGSKQHLGNCSAKHRQLHKSQPMEGSSMNMLASVNADRDCFGSNTGLYECLLLSILFRPTGFLL